MTFYCLKVDYRLRNFPGDLTRACASVACGVCVLRECSWTSLSGRLQEHTQACSRQKSVRVCCSKDPQQRMTPALPALQDPLTSWRMGSSGSKRRFIWQKKRSPVQRAWCKLQKLTKKKKSKSKKKPPVAGLNKLKPPPRPPWHHRLSLGALHMGPSKGGDSGGDRKGDRKGDKGPRDKRSFSLPLHLHPKN